MQCLIRRGLGATVCLYWAAAVCVADSEFVVTDARPWNVTQVLEYARETVPGSPPADDAYTSVSSDSLTFGLVSDTYWFRVRIRNATDQSRFAFVVENPRLGLVELWAPSMSGVVRVARVGDAEAPTQRVLGRRPPACEMRLKPGAVQTVYLRISHHGSLQLRAWVWPEMRFLRHRAFENVVDGALCGAIAIMVFYNILLAFHVRRMSYVNFTLFVLFYLFYTLALKGFGNDYVWPGREWFAVRGIICFYGCSSFFLHAFSRAFLDTSRRAPGWDMCIRAGMFLSLLVAVGSLSYSLIISYLAHLLVMVTPVYIIGASLACWYGGYRPAGIFFLAWSVLLMCAGTMSMVSLGWLPKNWYAENVSHGGFVVALALFSVAMDARARMSAERFRASLERQVADRTAQLQKALDNVRTLSGIVPICSHCKKVRNDEGYWTQVEGYLQRLGDVSLTHGVCPDCAEKHYPEYGKKA